MTMDDGRTSFVPDDLLASDGEAPRMTMEDGRASFVPDDLLASDGEAPRMTMDDGRASFVPDDLLASDGEGTPPASPKFPDGLRVLLVDYDPTCLKILERMLRTCLYEVTTCSRALAALTVLRERKGEFDLVIINVYMPDIDGFKLLELIGSEMNLPVIMMSSDDGKDVVMKGVTYGACDYLIKPLRMEVLKTIWQHVVRKRRNELKDMGNSGSVEEGDEKKRALDDGDNASSINDVNSENVKKRKEGKEEEGEIKEHEDSLTGKKPRVVWGHELHEKFVSAVEQLTVEKAVPKKILELMNIPELTRENVASHLQKYRLHLRRGGPSKHQGSFNADFSAARRDMNTATGVTAIDQIGFCNSDVQFMDRSRMRSASGQQFNTNQMNLLCGPSTSMDAMQLSQSQQAVQLYGNMGQQVSEGIPGFVNLPSSIKANSSFAGGIINGNLADPFVVQTTQQGQQFSFSHQQNHTHIDMQYQPQLNRHLLNAPADEHNSMLSSTIGQQILPSEISGHMSGNGGINGNTSLAGNYMSASSYGAVSQAQFPEFQNNYMTESAGNCYPLASSMEASSHTSIGMFQEAVPTTGSLEASNNAISLKGVKDSIPSYGRFGGLHQSKSQDWKSQNINLSYESAQHLGFKQNNIEFGSSNSTDGNSRNTCTVRKEIISVRTEIERKVGFMGGFAREPQEGAGQGEPEFTFDVFPLDEIQASS